MTKIHDKVSGSIKESNGWEQGQGGREGKRWKERGEEGQGKKRKEENEGIMVVVKWSSYG